MHFLGNLIWLLFGGLLSALGWFLAGLVFCITIVGIPFGIQFFKIGSFTLSPFGKAIYRGKSSSLSLLPNLLWIIIFGIPLAVSHLFFGLILCITVVGIPFGLQHFKLASIALAPFGSSIK